MILVDAAIWIDHLRTADPRLNALLAAEKVLGHPFVLGELALGNLAHRERTLFLLNRLPTGRLARHEEVMGLISRRGLNGRGIGYVDANLLASVLLTPKAALWTRDKRLLVLAREALCAYAPPVH